MFAFLDPFLSFANIIRARFFFVIELSCAILLFFVPNKVKKAPYVRIPLAIVAFFAFSFFFPESVLGIGPFITLLIFALSILLLWFVFDIPFRKTLFMCAAAYGVQSLVVRVYELSQWIIGFSGDKWYDLANTIIFVVLYAALYFLFIRRFRKMEHNLPNWLTIVTALCVLITTDIITKLKRFYGVEFVALLCCLILVVVGLSVLMGVYMASELVRNNRKMESMIKNQKEQYKIYKETISLINMKCHDLKHQLQNIRSGMDEKSAESIKEMEDAVMFYDSVVRTGNMALDSVLTQKHLLCERDKINISYIVDGDAVSFMKSSDIWSLFANAIDNAIECVRDYEDGKRVITVNVRKKRNLAHITIENACIVKPDFEDGLPKTTKSNKVDHGFGTQSIRYIANKYEGTAVFSYEEGVFITNILIPIRENSESGKNN